jgi:predicted transcriptional regulator
VSVLKALWELGPASVRRVHERLCPSAGLAFNTVQTVLRILEKKGLVEHEAQGRRFIYTARYTRCDLAAAFLHQAFDGQIEELLDCLLQALQPNVGCLDALQQLLNAHRRVVEAEVTLCTE